MFEIVGDVILGLVCFRMVAPEEMNQSLLTKFANFIVILIYTVKAKSDIQILVIFEKSKTSRVELLSCFLRVIFQYFANFGIVENSV